MALINCNLPKFMNTSTDDLINDFFIPLLKESIEYKRGVGFFFFRMV